MDLVSLQSQLDNLSFAILFLTMGVYWVGAAFPRLPYLQAVGTTGMAVANLCMAALLAARWIEGGYFPLSNLYESLFFLAWGVTAVHLFAENTTRSRLVGVATSPVAMGIVAFAALTLPKEMQSSSPLVPALKSNWLMMHVSVMMLSYSTLMVGSAIAIAFLVATRGRDVVLRGSSFGTNEWRDSLPGIDAVATEVTSSLAGSVATAVAVETPPQAVAAMVDLSPQRLTLVETLDNISYRTIGLGFPLLTIGIISGGVWANEAWGSYWSWDPKETWALITWLVFAAYLHTRITRGWQGRKPAIVAAAGFFVVWVCYLGVNLLGKGLHSYGWFF
jgi:cytochrome c-type biogenesis protein CcsB